MKSLSLTIALLLFAGTAQAQVTPQAIIGQCPGLPTPQQWATGDTEAFKAKIAELHDKLNTQVVNATPDVTQEDLEEALAQQRRQQEETNRQIQQNFGFDTNDMANMTEAELQAKVMAGMQGAQAQAMAQMDKELAALASLGITEADMKKLEKMNDKQAEAYMKKRFAENGVTEADFERAMMAAGAPVMSAAEEKARQQAEQKAQAEGEAIVRMQETLDAYMEQSAVTGRKIDEAGESAYAKINAITEKYRPQMDEVQAKANQWEEVMRGTKTKEELESWGRKAEALTHEYRAQVYQVWTEYIHTAQGHLKFLMPYAAAADDARAKMPSVTGNASTDQMMRMSNSAAAIAGQYLNITASEPNL